VAVSAALLAFLLASVDRQELARQLAGAGWGWVLVTVVLGLAGLYVRAFRWSWLFPPAPARPPGIVAATMIGYMANNVLPLRAGEVVRIYTAARRLRQRDGLGASQALGLVTATVVIERVLDSLAIVLILAVLVLVIPVPAGVEWGAGVLFAIDVLGVTALVVVARAPHLGRRLVTALTRRWPALQQHALTVFDTGLHALDGIRAPAHAARVAALTVVVWVMGAGAAWAMVRAVHLDLPFLAGWAIMAFVGLGISVPSAPGYVGVWHWAAALALGIFGAPTSVAVAYALLYHAASLVPVTIVGWLYLMAEHVSLGEARRTAV
jgi:uncharacterized protein (TIRG00374 family)